MPRITIYLYDYCAFSHCSTHIAAVLQDENETKKTFVIEYGQNDTTCLHFIGHSNSVVLFSNKNMNEFIEQYQKEFREGKYNILYKNCADAVDYVLNYFFPEAYAERCCLTTKKLVCCLPGIAFFGGVCVPAPLLITTPTSVFSKAKSISSNNNDETLSFAPSDQKIGRML